KLYGLEILAADIEDHPDNETRFVIIGAGIPARTGHDKTTIVVFQDQDRPGSLLAILQEFAARAVNLTKLESRPTKQGLGNYCFFMDCEGHIEDELVADVLRNLKSKHDVRFLGSYPAAGSDAGARRRAAGKAWRAASGWVDDLRSKVRPPDGADDRRPPAAVGARLPGGDRAQAGPPRPHRRRAGRRRGPPGAGRSGRRA